MPCTVRRHTGYLLRQGQGTAETSTGTGYFLIQGQGTAGTRTRHGMHPQTGTGHGWNRDGAQDISLCRSRAWLDQDQGHGTVYIMRLGTAETGTWHWILHETGTPVMSEISTSVAGAGACSCRDRRILHAAGAPRGLVLPHGVSISMVCHTLNATHHTINQIHRQTVAAHQYPCDRHE